MIYYVEDDTNIRDLTVYALRQAGFDSCGFSCAEDFFAALETQIPELVLLDIMLPETDGLEILSQLRAGAATKHVPVMMLTAKGTEYDTVCGLDAGADDYLSKPFGMMELVSRVNALLRRASEPAAVLQDTLTCDGIALSVAAHTITAAGVPVVLTLKEFDLIKTLMQHEGQVLTRDQLLEDVWGITYAGGTRTVDVHVQTLRQKLAAVSPGVEACIATVRGVGYSIKAGRLR
ncbi:MAG: response regulator transcription factor [Raoultibacter sp.]